MRYWEKDYCVRENNRFAVILLDLSKDKKSLSVRQISGEKAIMQEKDYIGGKCSILQSIKSDSAI